MATPVYDIKQQIRGIIIINVYAKNIFAGITSGTDGSRKYVINQDNYFLFYPDKSKEFGFDLGFDYTIKKVQPELVEEMKASNVHAKYHKQDKHVDGFKKIFFDPRDKNRYWALIYEIPESQAFKNIYLTRRTMIITGIIIIIFSLIIITGISNRRVIIPIIRLSEAAKKMGQGDLAARVQESAFKGDEIGELATSFNKMQMLLQRR